MNSSTLNKCAAIFWMFMFIPGMTIWKDSITFLVFTAIYAIVAAHLSGVTDRRSFCRYCNGGDDGSD